MLVYLSGNRGLLEVRFKMRPEQPGFWIEKEEPENGIWRKKRLRPSVQTQCQPIGANRTNLC